MTDTVIWYANQDPAAAAANDQNPAAAAAANDQDPAAPANDHDPADAAYDNDAQNPDDDLDLLMDLWNARWWDCDSRKNLIQNATLIW